MQTDTTPTSQIEAAGALMAILAAHTDLPETTPQLWQFLSSGTDIAFGAWGVKLSLHSGLTAFEQWREALDLDPATTDHGELDTTRWLSAHGVHHGVPVELVGFYTLPDTGEESAVKHCYFCGESTPDVEDCADPFAREINDEEWIIPICTDCYQVRCDEI
ncbi:hypothetical protein [Kitasatospora sp. NPDC092286]|uniref:hypothetical protein n=1 Tax=Kitasatospora sp. NPDC092286 TaxID=3364087 RepID=UPI0038285434